MVEAVVNILEAFEHKAQSPNVDGSAATVAQIADEEHDLNEVEYSDPYCKLSNAQHPEPFIPEVTNIKSRGKQKFLKFIREFQNTSRKPSSLWRRTPIQNV